jgi:lipid A 3-O-deacylase
MKPDFSDLRIASAARGAIRLPCLIILCTLIPLWKAQAQTTRPLTNDLSKPALSLGPPSKSIWERGVGEGFRSSTQSIGLSAGATYGIATFGSREAHDLALVSLTYGHMLGRTWGSDHWYRGNLEFRLELFTGGQFSPSNEWLVGLTPHLRYNFATGTRWIPFVDGGAGVTATSIGPPDLSGTFEFNLQAGTGIQLFLKDNVALTLEARYVHWSCAGISNPNLGLNGVTGMLGVTFFF